MWQYKVTHIVMVTGVCEAGKVGLLCVCARERVVFCAMGNFKNYLETSF